MTGQITSEQRLELQRLWDALLRQALSRGVSFQDAEDLVSNSLRNGLEHHDSARGEMLPFCRTILGNAIKNYWRDRKVDLPIDDEHLPHADEGPDVILEGKERAESMKRTIEHLSALLSKEELAFMRMLGKVVDEMGDRAVSETARRLGLKPTKGWDLFRRIQRKAHSLEVPPASRLVHKLKRSVASENPPGSKPTISASVDGLSVEPMSESHAPASMVIGKSSVVEESDTIFRIAGAMAREEGFQKFLRKLKA